MQERKKILIVEDDPIGRQLLSIYLKGSYEVTFASSLLEGMSIIDGETTFDLVITDLNLGIDIDSSEGVRLLKHIKEKHKYSGTAVVALTAHMFSSDYDKFLEYGFTELLVKPILKEHLLQKINTLLPSA